MTTYGTIPATSPGSTSTSLDFVSRAKERAVAGLGVRRPWKQMFDFHSVGFPSSFRDAISRSKTNIGYFRMNYAIIVLFILFVSLLWHPISLIVLIAMIAAWLFLYFLRDEPLMIFGRTISDRVVLIVLWIVTFVALLFTGAILNICVAILVGVVVVLIHSVLRKTEDLFLDEESAQSSLY